MSKYQGTVAYHLVYAELINAARYRGLTSYQRIAQIAGLPASGSHMGSVAGAILGEIVENELASGRPMLSALCVRTTGKPGPGFYEFAKERGRLKADTSKAKADFWASEREAVYVAWNPKANG
jgi:hypothetical protein